MTIYFLGGGNMASAIIGGMVKCGGYRIAVAERDADKAAQLAQQYGVQTMSQLPDLQADDVLVLAVKPQDMQAALQGVQVGGALVLSIAAGLSCAALSRWLGGTRRLVRVMPNTPAQVGLGVSGLFADAGVSDADRNIAQNIMAASGSVLWLPEEDGLHRITGITGSGPGYVFYLMNALAQAAGAQGFSQDEARDLVLQTFAGAAALARETGSDFATLQQNVMSKGGTTAAAIHAFDTLQVAAGIAQGVAACVARSREIAAESDATS